MLPKSKRAKRRNRHTHGKQLYKQFRGAEEWGGLITNIIVRDMNWFEGVRVTMVGGIVNG